MEPNTIEESIKEMCIRDSHSAIRRLLYYFRGKTSGYQTKPERDPPF